MYDQITRFGILFRESLRSSLWVVHAFDLYQAFRMSAFVKPTELPFPAPCTRICVALPSLIAEMSASVVKILRQSRGLRTQGPTLDSWSI